MPVIVPDDTGQTFLQLQDLALGDDFDATKYRTLAKQSINDAIDDISRQAKLPLLEDTFTVTTVPGTSSYDLPFNDVRILSAFDTDTRTELREVTREWIDEHDDQAGTAFAYAQYGGQVIVYYTPNAAREITFRYRRDATNLVSDTDRISRSLPDAYAFALVAFTKSRLFGMEDDATMSAFWRAEYERDLARIRGDVGRRRPARQVPGMWASSGRPRFRLP